MKNILALIIAALLCGCSKQPQLDPRVAELEKRCHNLENRLSVQEELLAATIKADADTFTILRSDDDTARERIGNLVSELNRLDDMIRTNAPVIRYQAALAASAKLKPVGMSNGVPATVYNQIVATAAKEYPGDYSTQEYQVRRQLEAFRKLNP
jgi:uncharacterized coiled-coil protein SlyX